MFILESYLNEESLNIASKISQKIRLLHLSIKKKFKNKSNLNKVKKEILKNKIKLDYFEIRNKFNLSKKINKSNYKIFIAYYIDRVRLIDNF